MFNWLVQRFQDKESYQAWHPDHVDIRWIKGKIEATERHMKEEGENLKRTIEEGKS